MTRTRIVYNRTGAIPGLTLFVLESSLVVSGSSSVVHELALSRILVVPWSYTVLLLSY